MKTVCKNFVTVTDLVSLIVIANTAFSQVRFENNRNLLDKSMKWHRRSICTAVRLLY